jgi:TonB family protein
VQNDGTALRLVWDRHAPAVRNADLAILEITDGSHISKLNLGSRELSSGMVSYWPETKDVSFRLQVLGNGHQTDDSIRAVGGQLAALPAGPVEAAPEPAPPVKRAPPATTAKVVQPPPPPVVNHAPAPAQGEAARAVVPESRPSPFVAPTQPVAETKPPAAAPPKPAVMAPREWEPVVSVEAEPVSGSRVGRVVSHIPLLKRLRKPVQPFVPPTPLHEAKPHLSARERVTDPTLVSVRVYVDKEGKVEFAEVQSGARHRTDLANAAIYAARHWDFTPAHIGEERVPGEVILHFRFAPPEPPRLAAQGR